MNRGVVWAAEPLIAQLLYGFLAVICLVTLVRAALLARALLALPGRKRISLDDIPVRIHADWLASSALAGAIRLAGPLGATPTARHDEFGRLSRLADARFEHGWHIAHARVLATKGLSKLAVLASVAVVCFDGYPVLFFAYWNAGRTPYGAFLAGANLLMMRLALGLAVSIVVGATAIFFEGCLIRRKAAWRLFRATVADASS